MSERINVNGVFREPPEVASLINGVWRKHKKIFTNINGVFRNIYQKEEKPFVCKGFILRYKLNKFRKHPDFPNLKYNKNIPVNFQLTEDTRLNNDITPKSVIFEYNNQNYPQEGTVMYEGHLYIITLANEEIDVGEIPVDSRLHDQNITVSYETIDENYGYEVHGWNSIFSTNQFLHSSGKPDVINQHHDRINDRILHPIWKHGSDSNATCDIGIVRDMTHPDKNMIGTRGHLTHTIYDIKFNNESKPFIIEIK